ncbi:hypothetical protein HNR60_000528 [Rhodopseudomonas rhenobacensis]|uniref:Amino acid permease n=1 Tax=Rhodopseudomonas rhenobacensis TaxID=87461 RepID=A0A7W7Z0R1_9BRAD|nr:amino acid transporter [Rhodopseudomonas rhenobacensis]MBB5045793.1 hypothetical protein [Rhodopseudomonas rhenobacensis]
MNKTSHNERRKLTATFVNTIGAAVFSVGGLGPIVSYATGLPTILNLDQVILLAAVCFLIGLGLHLGGRMLLGGLIE